MSRALSLERSCCSHAVTQPSRGATWSAFHQSDRYRREYREPGPVAGSMRGEDTQQLRDAIARWRADLDRINERLAELGSENPEWQSKFLERRALEIAIKALDLCIARRVVPRFVCPDVFVTEVVIPPKPRLVESESTIELSRYSHGPVVVEFEYGCASAYAALDLIDEAQRASIFTRGWAPLYVRLWVELLRHDCELALATPPQRHEGPRLVVAPEQDEENNNV